MSNDMTPGTAETAPGGRVTASGAVGGARDAPGAPGPVGGRSELRARLDAAIRPVMLLGLQDAELVGPGGTERINDWADWIVKTALEVLGQAEAAETEPRRRRSRLTDEHLRAVARVYGEALATGADPTRAVAELLQVPHSTAAKWVGHARRRGFLPPTRPGYAVWPGPTEGDPDD